MILWKWPPVRTRAPAEPWVTQQWPLGLHPCPPALVAALHWLLEWGMGAPYWYHIGAEVLALQMTLKLKDQAPGISITAA